MDRIWLDPSVGLRGGRFYTAWDSTVYGVLVEG